MPHFWKIRTTILTLIDPPRLTIPQQIKEMNLKISIEFPERPPFHTPLHPHIESKRHERLIEGARRCFLHRPPWHDVPIIQFWNNHETMFFFLTHLTLSQSDSFVRSSFQ